MQKFDIGQHVTWTPMTGAPRPGRITHYNPINDRYAIGLLGTGSFVGGIKPSELAAVPPTPKPRALTVTRNVTYDLKATFSVQGEDLIEAAAELWDDPADVGELETNEYLRGVVELITTADEGGTWLKDPSGHRASERPDSEEIKDLIVDAIYNAVLARVSGALL